MRINENAFFAHKNFSSAKVIIKASPAYIIYRGSISPRRKDEKENNMSEKNTANNRVSVTGTILGEPEYSHEIYGEVFYSAVLSVNRFSDKTDVIPIMISGRLIDTDEDYMGGTYKIDGQFRSYDINDGEKDRLLLKVHVDDMKCVSPSECDPSMNKIHLEGIVCRDPIYRVTPLGKEITDLMLAVNRPYGKTDHIPCIVWGGEARFAKYFQVGTSVSVWGRIQSRDYVKQVNDSLAETRTAYEVSVKRLECNR